MSLAWLDRYLDDDRIVLDVVTDAFIHATGTTAEELQMSEAISARLIEIAYDSAAGKSISADQMYDEINRIAESYGCEYGIPIPATGSSRKNVLVMARGVPLRDIISSNQDLEERRERSARMRRGPRELAMELVDSGIMVVNSWDVVGDRTICVVETDKGPMAFPRYHAVQRVAKLLRTLATRIESHMSAEAELRAQASLKSKINEAQWRCYLLNDCFLERSKKSDVHYVFRKGLPTLAVSYHGYPEGRVIAALCLHPVGFFAYTHAGLMTPTDEVICHLLMMRADEKKFWGKSGQWQVWDTRSGV